MMYMRAALAPGTQRAYATGIAAFRDWRLQKGRLPDELPTENEIGNWLAELGVAGQHTAGTLRTYCAAVGWWFTLCRRPGSAAPNPAADAGVKYILKGVERTQAQRAAERPLAPDATSRPLLLPTLLKYAYADTPRDRMLRAAALLGVSGGLRPGELLGNRDKPPLRREQFAFYADGAATQPMRPPDTGAVPRVLQLTLRNTKTSQFRPVVKLITAPSALAAVWRWFCDTADRGPSADLFRLTPTSPLLSTFALTSDLQRRHRAANLGEVTYYGKSWRQGGAGTLAAQGIDAADIAALGWAPNSAQWERYARDPQVQRLRQVARADQMEADVRAISER
jgi:hypothetical protein